MVHIPKAVYKAVYSYLFHNASLALKEYWRVGKVPGIVYLDSQGQTCNATYLHVNCIMQSLKSRGVVKDTFAWRHHYYMLTEKGEDFLRSELDLTSDIFPAPRVKQTAVPTSLPGNSRRTFSNEGRENREAQA